MGIELVDSEFDSLIKDFASFGIGGGKKQKKSRKSKKSKRKVTRKNRK